MSFSTQPLGQVPFSQTFSLPNSQELEDFQNTPFLHTEESLQTPRAALIGRYVELLSQLGTLQIQEGSLREKISDIESTHKTLPLSAPFSPVFAQPMYSHPSQEANSSKSPELSLDASTVVENEENRMTDEELQARNDDLVVQIAEAQREILRLQGELDKLQPASQGSDNSRDASQTL